MMNRVSPSKKAKDRSNSVDTTPGAFELAELGLGIDKQELRYAAMVLELSLPTSNVQIGRPRLSRRPIQWGYCDGALGGRGWGLTEIEQASGSLHSL